VQIGRFKLLYVGDGRATPRGPRVRTHTIGEVLNRLKDEFDDITISKIRFLEAEGLISPDRTESGYRKFTPADIDRLRYVLRAQRDRYLPLKVIKEELDRLDAGLPVGGPATPSGEPPVHDGVAADAAGPARPGPRRPTGARRSRRRPRCPRCSSRHRPRSS
jgi:DNA-binding transcriptional MerR regulator